MIKINRPTPKDVYLRHRLFELLDLQRRYPIIWISAPAGSGKTTLVTSYIETRKIPCLWYQLDPGDSDLATFFHYMGSAARKATPGKRLTLPHLTPEYLQGIPAFTMRYFEKIYSRLKPPFFIVFDNYQEIPSVAPLHDVMRTTFSMVPEGINIVVLSRNDVPPPFSKLRADRAVGIIDWGKMRFTEVETWGMLEQVSGPPLPGETVRRLHEMSRGWAAGLVLLNEVYKRNILPTDQTGEEMLDAVFKYFATEVFRHLDPKTRNFFLKTAFFPRMTVQMAEQLAGSKSAGSLLRALNRNNYFVVRHVGPETTYEYHPLYRQFLLNLAAVTLSPDYLSSIRKKAAAILEITGMIEAAIDLLKETASWDTMVGIVLSKAPDMIKQGRHLSLQNWLESLPEAVKEETPWLLFWEGASRLPFSPACAKPIYEKAFDHFQIAGDVVGAMMAASGVITAIAYAFNDFSPFDHWYPVLNGLALKMEQFPNDEIEAAVVTSLVTASILREIHSSETDTWEKRAINLPETPETVNTKAQAIRFIFWRYLLWKGCHDALPLLQELKRLSRIRWAHPLISVVVHSAEVQYHLFTGLHGNLVTAARNGLDLGKKTGIHMEDLFFHIHTAYSCLNRDDEAAALAWLGGITSEVESFPNWVKTMYYMELLRICCIRKDYATAIFEGKKAVEFAIKTGSGVAIATTQTALVHAYRILEEKKEGLKLLEQVKASGMEGISCPARIEIFKTEAEFAFDNGDDAMGIRSLDKALSLARKCGYFVTVFDNPVTSTLLFEKALAAGIEVEYVQEVIRRRSLIPKEPPFHLENWPWFLKIYTFGRFTIVKDGIPLRASGKVQQMPLRLLKALISLGGREISTSTLSEFLWPDADGDQAHQSFGTTLHRLRKLLGRADVIRLNDGKLTLENRYCWVDMWAFERFMAQADEYERERMPEKAWTVTEKALNLYKNHFLLSEGEESWIIPPAERLKAKYFRRLLRIGHAMEKADQVERAVHLYEKGLEIDDCNEELYRRLMVYYKNLGKKAEALALYERCRKLLSNSLGIEPSPETEAVRKALLSRPGYLRVVHTENRPRQ